MRSAARRPAARQRLLTAAMGVAVVAIGVTSVTDARQITTSGQRFERYAQGKNPASRFGPLGGWRDTIDSIKAEATTWLGSNPTPRRQLIVATYVLDLVFVNADTAWQPGGREFLEWACERLRLGPLVDADLERAWFTASIAILERTQGPPTVSTTGGGRMGVPRVVVTPYERTPLATAHVGHAERRLPSVRVWALARVIAEELDSWPEHRDEQPFAVSGRRATRLTTLFERAASHAETRDEGLVRWGYFELRRRQPDAALALFDQATPRADDPMLRYWLFLFKGRALERIGRSEEAATAYEQALVEVPDAQSAALALARTLLAARRPAESAAIVTRALATQPAPFDPWSIYSMPSSRHLPALMASLRESIRP